MLVFVSVSGVMCVIKFELVLSWCYLWVWLCCYVFFFFKQKTAYEMRISDWSSDVCSSDLMTLKEDDEVISLSILHRVGTKQEEREDYLRFAPWKPEKEGEPTMPASRFEELVEREQFILTVCANG